MTGTSARRRGPYAKTAERRLHIIDEAHRAFANRGYHGSSLREIAAAAGISLGSLQHHFASKDELLVAVLARRDELGGSQVAKAAGASFAEHIIAQAEHNESIPGLIALYSVLSSEAVDADHPAHGYFAHRYAALRRDYAAELTALRDAGRVREDIDPALAAATLVALWEGIQVQWLYDPGNIHAAASLRAYLDLIVLATEEEDNAIPFTGG